MKVILDTNFLVYCAEQKIDYIEGISRIMTEGYELVAPSQVVEELENLKKNAGKQSDRNGASLALQILKKNKIDIVQTSGKTADEGIIAFANGNIVATLDLDLRKKAEKTIIIQGKSINFG